MAVQRENAPCRRMSVVCRACFGHASGICLADPPRGPPHLACVFAHHRALLLVEQKWRNEKQNNYYMFNKPNYASPTAGHTRDTRGSRYGSRPKSGGVYTILNLQNCKSSQSHYTHRIFA